MAIQIDLLPKYVGYRRWFKRLLVVSFLLVGLTAAILYALYFQGQEALETLKTNQATMEARAQLTTAAQGAAKAATDAAGPIQGAVNFFVDAGKTGPERAALLDLLRRYIYDGAVVSTIDISDGQNVSITCTVRNPDEYARFLLNLRRATAPDGPLFDTLPGGQGIPGFGNEKAATGQAPQTPANAQPGAATGGANPTQPIVFPYTINVKAKLKNPIVIPVEPGGAPPAKTPGAGGSGSQ